MGSMVGEQVGKGVKMLKYLDIWHKVLEKWKGCGCSEMKRHVIAIKMCQMSDVRCQMSDDPGCILSAFWSVILEASNDCGSTHEGGSILREGRYFAPSGCPLHLDLDA